MLKQHSKYLVFKFVVATSLTSCGNYKTIEERSKDLERVYPSALLANVENRLFKMDGKMPTVKIADAAILSRGGRREILTEGSNFHLECYQKLFGKRPWPVSATLHKYVMKDLVDRRTSIIYLYSDDGHTVTCMEIRNLKR